VIVAIVIQTRGVPPTQPEADRALLAPH